MKPLGLRIKTFASVGLIIFLVLGSSTLVHVRELTRDYRQALIWRSEALIQSIINQIAAIDATRAYPPDVIEQLTRSCQELYDSQRTQHITHLAVFDADGRLMAHSEPGPAEADLNRPAFQEKLILKQHTTFLHDAIYQTFVPVFGATQQQYLGSVNIGFTKQALDEKVQQAILHAAILFIVLWGLACVLTFFLLQAVVIRPVRKLIQVGERLSEGSPVQTIYTTGQGDEIAALGMVFFKIARYMQHIAEVASHIAQGSLAGDVQIRSAHDALGKAVAEMLQYLRHVATVATTVAEGDFTETVQVRSSQDRFGQIIHTMVASLHALLAQLRTSAEELATTGVEISTQTEQDIALAERVHVVTENMMTTMQEIGASVEEVAQSMTVLSESVQETSDSVVMITTSITHIASNASELTERSHTTINAMEGATKSLEDVVNSTNVSEQLSQGTIQDALEGQQAFDQVMSSMNAIDGTIATAVAAITRFEQRSQDIDTILQVIRDIAEQTSLLALNASIIAAQAGERGRGFAVVADEIKGLAQGVSGSTKDIAKILHTLQQETATVVQTIRDGATSVREGMERTGQAQMTLQKIIESARRSSEVVSEIADALRNVMRTSRDVVNAMEEVSAMTDDFTAATSEQESSTEQINNAIAQINTMTAHIHTATDKQLRGVHQMLASATDVTALIDQNLESSQRIAETTGTLVSQADRLIHTVDRFKLEKPA